jgi:hypothetical protein
MRIRSRGNLARGIALVPLVVICLAGAIRASHPLLVAQRAPAEVNRVAASYSSVARHLRAGHEIDALEIWVDLKISETPLLIPGDGGSDVGDFSLQMSLMDASNAMAEKGGQWIDRCLQLAERLEETPNQTAVGLNLAWRIKRQAIDQLRTASAMAAESIP